MDFNWYVYSPYIAFVYCWTKCALIEVKGMNSPKALPLDQGGMVGEACLLWISSFLCYDKETDWWCYRAISMSMSLMLLDIDYSERWRMSYLMIVCYVLSIIVMVVSAHRLCTFSLCGPALCAWCMSPESNMKYYSSVAFIWEKCADAPDIY